MGCTSSKTSSSKIQTNRDENVSAPPQPPSEWVEGVVCKETDLKDNEMKAFDMPEDAGKVLVVKQNGKINALGWKCTHYGAGLQNGVLGNGRIRCQWHGACFNVSTGDIEDFPGLDSLPCYQVTAQNGNILVKALRSELESNKRVKCMGKVNETNQKHFVVIGGGPSGAACVETLRQEGYDGKLSLICRENYLPYDRVKVNKAMDFDIIKAQFRDDDFYKNANIKVYKNNEATAVNTEEHKVFLKNGEELTYDKLYIATGMSAVKLDIEGSDLKNVFTLREYVDSKECLEALQPTYDVVILGSSFIAMEAAAYLVDKVKKVTVVARGTLPFQPLLGEEIGQACKEFFESKKVNFIWESGITQCISDCDKVKHVELLDGTKIEADIVIMGIGGKCYTDFLEGSGIDVNPENGTIEVDEYLQSNNEDVFVGGDIACAPVWSHNNEKHAIGHYPLAHYHGRIAAFNMLGKKEPLRGVPYFWSQSFGKSIRYAGHGPYDDVIIWGNLKELKFAAFYLYENNVVAASSCQMDPIVSQFAELLYQGKKLSRSDIETENTEWVNKLYSGIK